MGKQEKIMPFADSPQDAMSNVAAVLDFVAQTMCWVEAKRTVTLPDRALNGLSLILLACRDTLQEAERKNQQGQ